MQSLINSIKSELYEQLCGSIDHQFGRDIQGFSEYQEDPVGFIKNEMGITLTPDIAKMAKSVQDYHPAYREKFKGLHNGPDGPDHRDRGG